MGETSWEGTGGGVAMEQTLWVKFTRPSLSPDKPSLVPEVMVSCPGDVQAGVPLLCCALQSRVPVQIGGKRACSFHVYLYRIFPSTPIEAYELPGTFLTKSQTITPRPPQEMNRFLGPLSFPHPCTQMGFFSQCSMGT